MKDHDDSLRQRNRFSRIALLPALATTLLALLAMAAQLHAQSGQNPFSPPSQPDANPERLNDYGQPTPDLCATAAACAGLFSSPTTLSTSAATLPKPRTQPDQPSEGSKPPLIEPVTHSTVADLNRSIYYKNRLEFSLDGGWLPINIPFVFDVFLGDSYNMTPLKYTLVPIIASLRWQMDDVGGPWILRGNWDLTASGAVVVIPRGPETRYYAWIMGIRRNFVPRNSRIAPYFDGRLGLGNIDAKEPLGVKFAQGQDFTFTLNMGSGIRYNFSPRYSLSVGLNYMHISNLYLSEPKYSNYGVNVYGPIVGIDVRLGKPRRDGSQ